MKHQITISGAGLAGLIAAHAFPGVPLVEAAPEPRAMHRAVLRFRSDAVAKLTGIDFMPVTVRKGIWFQGEFVAPNIQLANFYSRKAINRVEGERSIWNLEAAQRWIAPENFYEQLVDAVGNRIAWNTSHDYTRRGAVISTAPLPAVLEAVGIAPNGTEFHRAPISVHRARVAGCSVFQTVYFPDPELLTYRASITGDLLIIEGSRDSGVIPLEEEIVEVLSAFGLDQTSIDPIDSSEQRYGKIVPLAHDVRRALLYRLTQEHDVFSLGRFATWRNILLDDVVQDIAVVRRLLRASKYEHALFAST